MELRNHHFARADLVLSGGRPYEEKRNARVSLRRHGVRDPVHGWKLTSRKSGDLGGSLRRYIADGTVGEGPRPTIRHVRRRGVGRSRRERTQGPPIERAGRMCRRGIPQGHGRVNCTDAHPSCPAKRSIRGGYVAGPFAAHGRDNAGSFYPPSPEIAKNGEQSTAGQTTKARRFLSTEPRKRQKRRTIQADE